MQRLTVEEMKQIELELMDEFDRICREQGITYFLGYGTLLGAVRHGGFIPWDDDMDVLMMRSEYERFVAGFEEWKSNERFSLAWYRDGESIYPFAKLIDNNTLVYENFSRKEQASGVWVDLFPLDNVDVCNLQPFKRGQRLELKRNFIVADPSVGSSFFIKLVKRIVCPFARHFNVVKCARAIDENAMQACGGKQTDVVADIVGEGKVNLLFPKQLFEPIEMNFEGRSYLAPSGFEEFMTIQYGNWRKPPAESDRDIHVCEAYRL